MHMKHCILQLLKGGFMNHITQMLRMTRSIKNFNAVTTFMVIATFSNFAYATTTVTCIFKNTTDIPVTFKSFQDTNNRPVEIKNLNAGQSFKSSVPADKTVTYDIQPNIHSYAYPFMLNGAYNIVFNTPSHPHEFSLEKGSFTNPDPASGNAVLSTVQVTNRTTFPVNASILLKNMGQSNDTANQPYPSAGTTNMPISTPQATNTTKLPVNGFYAITDTIEKLTIASGLNGYNSGPLSPSSIKSRCEIVNHNGTIKTYMGK